MSTKPKTLSLQNSYNTRNRSAQIFKLERFFSAMVVGVAVAIAVIIGSSDFIHRDHVVNVTYRKIHILLYLVFADMCVCVCAMWDGRGT